MTIEVKQISDTSIVNVISNDQCLHAETDMVHNMSFDGEFEFITEVCVFCLEGINDYTPQQIYGEDF